MQLFRHVLNDADEWSGDVDANQTVIAVENNAADDDVGTFSTRTDDGRTDWVTYWRIDGAAGRMIQRSNDKVAGTETD